MAWSPQGDRLAAISARGELVLWGLGDPARSRLALDRRDHQTLDCLGFSADGQYLAVGGQSSCLLVWDLQAEPHPLQLERDDGTDWIEQLAWNPVSGMLAVAVGRQVKAWNLSTLTQVATLDFEASTVLGLAWHPQGQYLAVSGHGGVKVWDLDAPITPPIELEVPGASLGAAWSTDGRYLASGNLDRTLSVLDWGSPPPWLMQGFPGRVSQLAWSPVPMKSGSPLLAAACVDGITVWQRQQGDQGNWTNQVFTGHQGVIETLGFQPGTTLLASGGREGGVYLWERGQRLHQRLKGLQGGTTCLAWHPSGQWLAGGGMDGTVLMWTIDATRKGFG